ncbi:MAG TPA: hypothetical protein VF668_22410 [Pyrinomonadaceae bacterium]|jgi:hypothetical protein
MTMPTIPIVSEIAEALKALPAALAEVPASQAKARKEVLESVTKLAEAVSQALNVVSVRCGEIILKKDDLKEFREALVRSPSFLNEFRLSGVCDALGNVRAELRTILNMKRFSIRLFYKKRLESLLEQIQYKERDLEEDFDKFFRELSWRAPTLKKTEIPEIIEYLRECRKEFEADAQFIRDAMRQIENTL